MMSFMYIHILKQVIDLLGVFWMEGVRVVVLIRSRRKKVVGR